MARSRAEVIGLPFVLSRRHGIISVDTHPTHGIRHHCHSVPSLSGAVAPCRTSSLRMVRKRKPARGVGSSYISTLAGRAGVLTSRPTVSGARNRWDDVRALSRPGNGGSTGGVVGNLYHSRRLSR